MTLKVQVLAQTSAKCMHMHESMAAMYLCMHMHESMVAMYMCMCMHEGMAAMYMCMHMHQSMDAVWAVDIAALTCEKDSQASRCK